MYAFLRTIDRVSRSFVTAALLTALAAPIAFAGGTQTYKGARYRDLSWQYRKTIPQQSSSNDTWRTLACHTYAATALIEAACYRRTQKHIDLSEPALLYYNYMKKLSEKSDLVWNDFFPSYSNVNPQLQGILGFLDAGYASRDIGGENVGAICEQKQFISMSQLSNVLHSSLRIVDMAFKILPEIAPRIQVFPTKTMKGIITERMRTIEVPKEKPSKAFLDCFAAPLEEQTEFYSEKEALDLLDRGIPFVCHTFAEFEDGKLVLSSKGSDQPIPFALKPESDEDEAEHETNIVGYRKDANGKIRWLVRDSNFEHLVWSTGNCSFITYIK